LDLEQIHEDQDPELLIKKGVKRGIARRFVSDIEGWASVTNGIAYEFIIIISRRNE